uniref:Uncharacterized protein n=1 Tax=viral metagenome TaxID=1070528 RepID=A0A6C0DFN0_9ZZZZ
MATTQDNTAALNRGKVPELYNTINTYRSTDELQKANTLLENIESVKDTVQLQTAQFQDSLILGDQFFGSSANSTALNEVAQRSNDLKARKAQMEETLQKSRGAAERLDRDFIDVKETLPETLSTRIIHMLDDYTLVVLMISFFFMVLSLVFIYAATQGYTLISILKGSGYGLLLSVFMFVFASIIL